LSQSFTKQSLNLVAASFAGVFFMGGASLVAKLVSAAKDAALLPLPDVPVSYFVLLPDFFMGTHFRVYVVVAV
jgi:hypothetical protein